MVVFRIYQKNIGRNVLVNFKNGNNPRSWDFVLSNNYSRRTTRVRKSELSAGHYPTVGTILIRIT